MSSRCSMRILSVLVVSVALLPALLASAAQAEVWSHRDAARDVVRYVEDGESGNAPTREDREADIRRIRVTHTMSMVRVVVRVADMRRRNQVGSIFLRTPGNGLVLAEVIREGRQTWLDLIPLSEDEMAVCGDAAGRFRPKRDLLVARIPRSCLNDPKWVRASVVYATFDGRWAKAKTFRIDDGLRDRGFSEGRAPAWSPRLGVS